MQKNAVIVRAGRNSTHRLWLSGTKPKFDLIVAAYDALPAELTEVATSWSYIKGSKVSGWAQIFENDPDILERYDRIAMLDDDLICSALDINAAFELGEKYNLSLWQPSLSRGSFFTYAIFQSNPLFELRFVNFIEMMCPFFKSGYLRACLPLFGIGYETGIDQIWCCLHPVPKKAFAVLDRVTVLHPRSVGENRSAQGFVGKYDRYQDVVSEMENRLARRFRGAVAYAAITRSGYLVGGRAIMACCALAPLSQWATARQSRYVKRFMILFRHILTRPIDNDKIDVTDVVRKLTSTDNSVGLESTSDIRA